MKKYYYLCPMKEAIINKRTPEVIFNDQKAEIDSWSDELVLLYTNGTRFVVTGI